MCHSESFLVKASCAVRERAYTKFRIDSSLIFTFSSTSIVSVFSLLFSDNKVMAFFSSLQSSIDKGISEIE